MTDATPLSWATTTKYAHFAPSMGRRFVIGGCEHLAALDSAPLPPAIPQKHRAGRRRPQPFVISLGRTRCAPAPRLAAYERFLEGVTLLHDTYDPFCRLWRYWRASHYRRTQAGFAGLPQVLLPLGARAEDTTSSVFWEALDRRLQHPRFAALSLTPA